MRTLFIFALFLAAPLAAQQFYEAEHPGHGVAVQQVTEDAFVLQWFFHDGHTTRWVVSDVCDNGALCDVWTVDAIGFPALGSRLVPAGDVHPTLMDRTLLLDYALNIKPLTCAVLPGPYPPNCRGADGKVDRSIILRRGLEQSGTIWFDLLVE